MSIERYKFIFMSQVYEILSKNAPLKSTLESFLDGASGKVNGLSEGVDKVSQGVTDICYIFGALTKIGAKFLAGAATFGAGADLVGAGLEIAHTGYKAVRSINGAPISVVFLKDKFTEKEDKLKLELLFNELACKLALEYSYFIEEVAADNGIETLAIYAANSAMLQWLILTQEGKSITIKSLRERLFQYKYTVNTPVEVKEEYKLSNTMDMFFGSYCAENIYSCPVLIKSSPILSNSCPHETNRWKTFSIKKSAGPEAYRVISENDAVPLVTYGNEREFIDLSNISANFKTEYLIDSPIRRKVVEDYLKKVRIEDFSLSLNEYLKERFGVNLIATCHDDTLKDLNLSYGDFSNVNFNRANLSGCRLVGTKWKNAYLQSAVFGNTPSIIELFDSDWTYAHLECSQWDNVNLNTTMVDADLRRASFNFCIWNSFVGLNCSLDLVLVENISTEMPTNWPRTSKTLYKAPKNIYHELFGLFYQYEDTARKKSPFNHLFHYIEPKVLPFKDAKVAAESLSTKTDNFLLDNHDKLLLLHGMVGSGKSSWAEKLQKTLWQQWEDRSSWVPILIEMKDVEEPKSDFLNKYFEKCKYSEEQIFKLKQFYKFLIIFDGLDECKNEEIGDILQACNISDFSKAKVIITSRQEFFLTHENVFNNFAHYNKKEYFLTSITSRDRDNYLKAYFDKDYKEYHDFLVASEELVRMAESPLMLYILCAVMPNLKGIERTAPYTQIELYGLFFENWILRAIEKKTWLPKFSDTKKKIKESFWDYTRSLAFTMFRENSHTCDVKRPTIKRFFDSNRLKPINSFLQFFNDETTEDRHLCPLSVESFKDGSDTVYRYRFIHESFREYMAASFLWESFIKNELEYWNHRFLSEEPGILKFLSEFLISSDNLSYHENSLMQIVSSSKKKRSINLRAASSAITLLNTTEYPFHLLSDGDLSNIKIPNANLQGAFLPNVNFHGSDLSGVCFTNAMLYSANFDRAKLERACFSSNQLMVILQNKLTVVAINPINTDKIAYAEDNLIKIARLSNSDIKQITTSSHTTKISHLTYAPSGDLLSCDKSGNFKLWSDFGCYKTFKTDFKEVTCVLFSKDSKILAVAGTDESGGNQICLFDMESTALVIPMQKCERNISSKIISLAFSPDSNMIACGSENTEIHYWEINKSLQTAPFLGADVDEGDAPMDELRVVKPKHRGSLLGHSAGISSLVFSHDGSILYSGSFDKTLRAWDLDNGSSEEIKGHAAGINSISLSPSGLFLATGGLDGTICVWAIQSFEKKSCCMKTITGNYGCILNVSFISNDRLISASTDSTLRLWDLSQYDMRLDGSSIKGHVQNVSALSYSPNGKYLVSGGQDKDINLWDNDGKCIKTLKEHSDIVTCIAHASDLKFASGSENEIILWYAEQEFSRLRITSKAEALVFSPDGKRLASGHFGNIYIWNVEKPEKPFCEMRLSGHTSDVYGLSFDETGRILISSGLDATVRIWDLKSNVPPALAAEVTTTPPRIKHNHGQVSPRSTSKRKAEPDLLTITPYFTCTLDEGITSLVFSSQKNMLILGSISGNIYICTYTKADGVNIIKEIKACEEEIITLIASKAEDFLVLGSKNHIKKIDFKGNIISELPFGSSAISLHDNLLSFSYEQAIYGIDLKSGRWSKAGPCAFWPMYSSFNRSSGIDISTSKWLNKHGVESSFISPVKGRSSHKKHETLEHLDLSEIAKKLSSQVECEDSSTSLTTSVETINSFNHGLFSNSSACQGSKPTLEPLTPKQK